MTVVEEAKTAIRDAMHAAVKDLSRSDYRDVLEDLVGELEARLEAVQEEMAAEQTAGENE